VTESRKESGVDIRVHTWSNCLHSPLSQNLFCFTHSLDWRRLGINVGVEDGELVRLDAERSARSVQNGWGSTGNHSVEDGGHRWTVVVTMSVGSSRVGIPIEGCTAVAIAPIEVEEGAALRASMDVTVGVSVDVERVPASTWPSSRKDRHEAVRVTVDQGTAVAGDADLGLTGLAQSIQPTHSPASSSIVVNVRLGTGAESIRRASGGSHPSWWNRRGTLVLIGRSPWKPSPKPGMTECS